jgi:hypothetical protein
MMLAPPDAPDLKEGSREVLNLLEATLDRAQVGDITHLCIVATSEKGAISVKAVGVSNNYCHAFTGLSILQDEIKLGLTSRRPPSKDRSLTADYVCFNVAQAPCSYDFIAWLVDHEMDRVAKGAPFPLKVYFYFGPNNDRDFAFQYARRQQMFENVIRPALAFVGAVEDEKAVGGVADSETYSFAPIVERVNRGEKVPQFKPVCTANNNGAKPVIITLRETTSALGRNSRLDEWMKFAKWLRERGERVIFLRDTDKAEERMEDFELCPVASTNIDARLAVYLDAKCNLFVANGPATLAFFTDVPWMLFHYADPLDEHYPSTPNGWKQYAGISPGEQFPWCNEKQRIIWEAPEFANMKAAWEEMWG